MASAFATRPASSGDRVDPLDARRAENDLRATRGQMARGPLRSRPMPRTTPKGGNEPVIGLRSLPREMPEDHYGSLHLPNKYSARLTTTDVILEADAGALGQRSLEGISHELRCLSARKGGPRDHDRERLRSANQAVPVSMTPTRTTPRMLRKHGSPVRKYSVTSPTLNTARISRVVG
jgi:hypothetical protein